MPDTTRSQFQEELVELEKQALGGLDMVEKAQPDILVLDLSMPDLDGISVTKKIKLQFPDLRILFFYFFSLLTDDAVDKGG